MSRRTTPSTPTETTTLTELTVDETNAVDLYNAMKTTGDHFATILRKGVINPVARQHFEDDNGIPVTQVLPDRTENYQFESHGFEALILPDTREILNHGYNGQSITATRLTSNPDAFHEIIAEGEQLWTDTFGEHKRGITQTGHPGPYPLKGGDVTEALNQITTITEHVIGAKSLDVVIAAARDDNHPLLSTLFGTTEGEILTPGGTDLSAVPRTDTIHVPYNDGELAILRPTTERTRTGAPTRGVVIGHDDTPVGIFAHVIDVTNLSPDQQTTHDAIRDAMGFDRELDPWEDIDSLNATPGERIRLQGDLRVERTDAVDGFPDELARTTRLTEYRARVTELFEGIDIPSDFVRGRRSDVPVIDVLNPDVSADGGVVIDPSTSDPDVELLAYTTFLIESGVEAASAYDSYDDFAYVGEPQLFRRSFATVSVEHAVQQARSGVLTVLEAALDAQREPVEETARETAAEAEVGIDVSRQVNLPVDNHMTFLEDGYAPDVDTEPVPVAVPDETTLHIVHGEHNTVTTQIDPGVYRFSLLPRGLQPPEDRPDW